MRILDSKQDADFIQTLTDLPSLDQFTEASSHERFCELLELLQFHGVEVEWNRNLVRGLDYYSGTCFEIKCSQSGVVDAVLG